MPRTSNCPCPYCDEVYDNPRRRRYHIDKKHAQLEADAYQERLEEYRQSTTPTGPSSRLKVDKYGKPYPDVWPARA
jgi:hypothetical protein